MPVNFGPHWKHALYDLQWLGDSHSLPVLFHDAERGANDRARRPDDHDYVEGRAHNLTLTLGVLWRLLKP